MFFAVVFFLAVLVDPVWPVPINVSPRAVVPTYCSLPDATSTYQTVDSALVNINQTIVNQAIMDASVEGSVSIKVFRYNCLVASSQILYPLAITDPIRKNIFSATKGVISILTGIAYDQGFLRLVDDPIGQYLPASVMDSWGDAAHRAITIRQLLTETAGTEVAVVSEAATVLTDVSLPQEALAQAFNYPPGTTFQYSQRVPDLMAYIVSRAVGQELQAFAQANLFTPVGITEDRYIWLKDRSGNTYGYAWLYLLSDDFARLGLMMQNGGTYNGVRIVSESYVDQVSIPSPTNGCYGLLFWTNRVSPTSPTNDTCISPEGYLFHRSWIPAGPRDLYAMSGSPQQKNFMIPSLSITVSWMGVLTDDTPSADVWYQFFKTLMPGILDEGFVVPGPGMFDLEPVDLSNIAGAFAPSVLLADLNSSPSCNFLICNGTIPLGGLISNVQDVVGGFLSGVGGGTTAALNKLVGFLKGT